jgi:hypothetical protein
MTAVTAPAQKSQALRAKRRGQKSEIGDQFKKRNTDRAEQVLVTPLFRRVMADLGLLMADL